MSIRSPDLGNFLLTVPGEVKNICQVCQTSFTRALPKYSRAGPNLGNS